VCRVSSKESRDLLHNGWKDGSGDSNLQIFTLTH
jgi:hypothetical protein